MKKNICCILSSLILICVFYIGLSSSFEVGKISIDNSIKFVDSEVLLASITTIDNEHGEEVVIDIVEEEESVISDVVVEKEKEVQEVAAEEEKEVQEVGVEKKEEIVESNASISVNSNEIITGKMTGYGPDCYGCSGYLAYGMYVGDGTIYYNDSEYGKVRIVAGDKKYKFGTIVKINDSMVAIVLDRGGSIGIGKKFLFDLLYSSESEASNHGVMNNVKFEILRNGF